MKRQWFGIALSALAVSMVSAQEWNASNHFSGWGKPYHLEMKATDEGLELKNTGHFAGITIQNLKLDPSEFNTLEIVYRATGGTIGNSGGLYFLNQKNDTFRRDYCWSLPRVQFDGKWHTMRLKLSRAMLGKEANWTDGGTVSAMRLNMTEQGQGIIELKSVRFLKLTSEEYGDSGITWTATDLQNCKTHQLDKEILENAIRFEVIADPGSFFPQYDSNQIDLSVCNAIEIRYRAESLPTSQTNFVVNYVNSKVPGYTIKSAWVADSLNGDGKWHTLKMSAQKDLRQPEQWLEGGTVKALRIIPVYNGKRGVVEIESIRFFHE